MNDVFKTKGGKNHLWHSWFLEHVLVILKALQKCSYVISSLVGGKPVWFLPPLVKQFNIMLCLHTHKS